MNIAIVDYGGGNVGSVRNMLSKIDVWSEVIDSIESMRNYNAYILPGVGSYDKGIFLLKKTGFWNELIMQVEMNKKPILGICLGMQMFFDGSEEGNDAGFGWFPGRLKQFPSINGMKTMNMGWQPLKQNNSVNNIGLDLEGKHFYFAHGFHAPEDLSHEYVLAYSEKDLAFPAVVRKGNIMGAQFHPEKSLTEGMLFFSSWTKWVLSNAK